MARVWRPSDYCCCIGRKGKAGRPFYSFARLDQLRVVHPAVVHAVVTTTVSSAV